MGRLWHPVVFGAVTVALLRVHPAAAWDSANRNPTHPTHTYLTEYAIRELKHEHPDVDNYRKQLIAGSNTEIHELPIKCTRYGVDFNERRANRYIGTNAGCKRPDLIWSDAQDACRQGKKELAYFLIGVLLHQIQDMGVPAHAHDIYHQGNATEFDNFEFMALWNWKPDFLGIDKQDPRVKDPAAYADPSAFYEFSRKWCIEDVPHYASRKQFSKTWTFASPDERKLLRKREAATAMVTKWALAAAVIACEPLRAGSDRRNAH